MLKTKDKMLNTLWKVIQKLNVYHGISVTENESSEIDELKQQLDYVRQALILIAGQLPTDPDREPPPMPQSEPGGITEN